MSATRVRVLSVLYGTVTCVRVELNERELHRHTMSVPLLVALATSTVSGHLADSGFLRFQPALAAAACNMGGHTSCCCCCCCYSLRDGRVALVGRHVACWYDWQAATTRRVRLAGDGRMLCACTAHGTA